MLDLCIEIPQYGIIRSLNVHVSGSILLWEYISFSMVPSVSFIIVHIREYGIKRCIVFVCEEETH